MQSVLSRIWTRVAVSNSYDDYNYTTGTSFLYSNSLTFLIHNTPYVELKTAQTKIYQFYGSGLTELKLKSNF